MLLFSLPEAWIVESIWNAALQVPTESEFHPTVDVRVSRNQEKYTPAYEITFLGVLRRCTP
jgi:uncharacterized protein YcnI